MPGPTIIISVLNAGKRNGKREKLSLESALVFTDEQSEELLALDLAACDTVRDAAVVASVAPSPVDPVQEPTDVKYYASDEPLRMGLEHFNRGNYGIAQRYFKDAVEKENES